MTYGVNENPKTFEQDLVENDSIWSDVSISNASNTIKKWFK